MKLYITDEGDPSVGLSNITYTIETPFEANEVDENDLVWFKKQMELIYREFAEGRLTLWYEFQKNDEVWNF